MTITSLAKFIAGVKRMVVENVEIENPETNPAIIISVRPAKRDSCRCGICGKKCSGYDKGNGRRRWRAMDIGNSVKVYLESDSPRVWCKEHGAVVQMVPWARHGSKHTRSFEDTAVWMSLHLSRKAVSEYLRVSWDTVGPMVNRVEKENRSGENDLTDWSESGSTRLPTRRVTSTSSLSSTTIRMLWSGQPRTSARRCLKASSRN